MNHFAKLGDELFAATAKGELHRNFFRATQPKVVQT